MQLIRAILVCFAFAAMAAPANAQSCSFSMTAIDFGTTSLTVGGNTSTSGTLTATCSGTPNQTIEICANFGQGSGGSAAGGDPRYMTNGASIIEYSILRGTGGGGQEWGSWLWPYAGRPPGLSLTLGADGQGSLSRAVNARMSTNQPDAATGLHTSSFAGSDALLDYGYDSSFNCSGSPSSRAAQVPFIARINNNASCTLAATAMNFGTVTLLNAVRDATSTITVTCTKGTNYTLGLSNGSGGGTGPTQRRMVSTSSPGFVTYGIYRDAARTQPWGDTLGVNTANGKGNGRSQALTAFGRIPIQAAPLSDTYTDTIIATITY